MELTIQGNLRTLRARLFDQDKGAHRIADRTIDFYADSELIGSAVTDESGEATLEPPARYRDGEHTFEARFVGDDFYMASSHERRASEL